MMVILIAALILGMMFSVVPWLQPNGGLWLDIHWANLPPYSSEEIPGLDAEVQIIRDQWGVPHIFATTTPDLYLACGYVHAQDRLFQLDLYRRVAQGKLAELFGPQYFDLDVMYRNLGLTKAAEASVALLSPETNELLESYAAGINRYMETIGTKIPVEFRVLGYFPIPWTKTDTLSIERFLAWVFSGPNAFDDLQMPSLIEAYGNVTVFTELFPDIRYNDIPIVPAAGQKSKTEPISLPDDLINSALALANRLDKLNTQNPFHINPIGGSNAWVVNGSLTNTGAPFLCNDPHLSLSYPPLWYEIHLIGPEENVQGITYPGIPFVFQGHNTHIAWGFSGMHSDVSDFYYYSWNPVNSTEYWWQGSWHAISEESTTIYSYSGGQLLPTTVTFNYTVHGPLFDETGGRFALKWTGHNGSQTIEALHSLAQATNHSTFISALQLIECPNLNFIYADTVGNIAYHATGAHPLRAPGDGPSTLNGSAGAHEWMGFIPFNELPQNFNPPTGFVVTANNRPVNASYPYYLGYNFVPAHRAQRITSLVNNTSNLSLTDMKQIQLDSLSLHAEAIKDIVASVVLATVSASEKPLVHEAATIIQNWDAHMGTDSIGATIWTSFSPKFVNATFYDEYFTAGTPQGPYPAITVLENFTQINYGRWFNNTLTPGTQTRDDIIISSFEATVNELSVNLGADSNLWQYHRVHNLWIQHAISDILSYLNPPVYPINGSEYTVNYAPNYLVTEGASYRQIIDLANFDSSQGVLPGGQRMNPYSSHYMDQFFLWVAGNYHPLTFPLVIGDMTVYESIFHLIPG